LTNPNPNSNPNPRTLYYLDGNRGPNSVFRSGYWGVPEGVSRR